MSLAKQTIDTRRTKPQPGAAARCVEVLIVGAGIGGIGAAIRLLREGMTDFVVLEKARDLGGTWRDNTYPGCACDIPSALYSYSFAQKSDWTRAFAGQPEILGYVRETAEAFGVLPHVRFNATVEAAVWDEREQHWVVTSAQGVYHARSVISCAGYLHEPIIPDLPGLAEFKGKIFHSSRWDHAHDLTGERVAVIGTGASAIQFVPEIQPRVARLSIFQRTPQWVLPKPDHVVPAVQKSLLNRLPLALNALRNVIWAGFESFGIGFRYPSILKGFQNLGLAHLRLTVRDKVLREKLTPDYTLGCKRVLMSNDYYPALTQPNVEVFATGVRAVRGNVVVGADGSQCEVDTIILSTGFHVTDPPIAELVTGREGKTLAEVWDGSPQAYRGTTIAGFPNLYIVLGPNLGIGHNSAFVVIEAQLEYAIGAVSTMRKLSLSKLEVRAEVQAAYNEKVQAALQGTVWNTGGCSSYYIDSNGRNSIGFPWSTVTMRRLLERFDLDVYDTRAAVGQQRPDSASPEQRREAQHAGA